MFVLKTKWELFALVCAGQCCVITGTDTIFRVSMIHGALRSLRLIRSWEGLPVCTFSHPVSGKTMKPSQMEPRTECCLVPPTDITLVSLLFGATRLLSIVMRTLCAVGGGWRAQPWPKERHKAADEIPNKAHHRKLGGFSLEALRH